MRWRAALRAGVVAVTAAGTLATSFLAAGPFGLVVAADCLAAAGLVIALAGTPRSAAEPAARRTASVRAWLAQAGLRWRKHERPVVRAADFPSYAKISSGLGWATASRWHYDHGVRPLLIRLMQSALAEHHRVDAAVDPARARRLVGDEVWPLVDPARPPSFDSKAAGVDLRTISRIVDRLEQL